jgi:purine-cytosine permease-like protein
MNPADIGQIPSSARTQRALDIFWIFAGANIVATTLQVGAALSTDFRSTSALILIVAGATGGSLLVASLAILGPRLGVPSVIAARAALGVRGAGLVAALLYITNFAWIAVNNVIAASVGARLLGGPTAVPLWIAGLGLVSTAVVALGPRAVGLADRIAVPLLLLVGGAMTWAVIQAPPHLVPLTVPAAQPTPWFRGFDIVVGYQVSWILMFADYSRYTRSERKSAWAVFLGLLLTSLWMMPLGLAAARVHCRPGCDDGGHWPRMGGRRPDGPGHRHHQLREHLYVGAGLEESGAADGRPVVGLVDWHHRHAPGTALRGVAGSVRRVHGGAGRRAGAGRWRAAGPLPVRPPGASRA